jgi:hypothetical protein
MVSDVNVIIAVRTIGRRAPALQSKDERRDISGA